MCSVDSPNATYPHGRCPHTVINPVTVWANGERQYFCVSCGELVATSVPDIPQQLISGTPTELTEEERIELA